MTTAQHGSSYHMEDLRFYLTIYLAGGQGHKKSPNHILSRRSRPQKELINPCDKMNRVVQLSHYPNSLNSVIRMDEM